MLWILEWWDLHRYPDLLRLHNVRHRGWDTIYFVAKGNGLFLHHCLEPWKLILCHFYQGETGGLKQCGGGGPDLDSFLEASYTPFHKWYLETTLSTFHFGVSIGSAENNVSGVGGKVVNRDWWTAISKITELCALHTLVKAWQQSPWLGPDQDWSPAVEADCWWPWCPLHWY